MGDRAAGRKSCADAAGGASVVPNEPRSRGCYNAVVATFYVENFGCRATQADGAAIAQQLVQRGLRRAENPQDAQVVVLNTCTVTSAADHDARAAIRRIHRQNPECKILVTGCYAQRAPEEIVSLPGVAWVVGNSHKHQVAKIAAQQPAEFVPVETLAAPEAVQVVGDIFAHTELMAAPVFEVNSASEKTRPNLKVQDGCDNRCSFCIIPFVRGQSRSLQLDEVLREMNGLVAAGFREVVISGINLGRWGRDLDRPQRFEQLVRALVEKTGIERLRISSVEPMDWSDELIELVACSPRIAKHAHVPLQSGSDRILRLMHRKYRPWHYAAKIRKIRRAMPTAAIGADVMVGFPGETDADFEENRRFIASLPFTYLHVFTYSARPGTPSAKMPERVLNTVKRERNRILRELAAEKKRVFMEGFVGKTLSTITLNLYDGDYTETLSDNYLKLMLRGRHGANQMVEARVESLRNDHLIGAV